MPKAIPDTEKQKLLSEKYPDLDFSQFFPSEGKTSVGCKHHGVFEKTYKDLTRTSQGCPTCNPSGKLTNEQFLCKIREAFPDTYSQYDLSRVEYSGARNSVIILCPTHGEVSLSPLNLSKVLANGNIGLTPCSECNYQSLGRTGKHTQDSFIKYVQETNPNNLDLSRVKFVNTTTKVEVGCNECGAWWSANPGDISGVDASGCPECGRTATNAAVKRRNLPWEEVVRRSKEVHGDRYEYHESEDFRPDGRHISMTCRVHGLFTQKLTNHVGHGTGCPTCGKEAAAESRRVTYEESFARSRAIHGDLFEYPEEGYKDASTPMQIICKTHGLFSQLPYSHWSGNGCEKCGTRISRGQQELANFLASTGVEIELEYKFDGRKAWDIVCHSKKLAVEYNGLYFHSESYQDTVNSEGRATQGRKYQHLQRTLDAEALGYRLVHIYEDEWLKQRPKVENLFHGLLGVKEGQVVGARETTVKDIPWAQASALLNEFHLQGAGAAGKWNLGLFLEEELLAVMVFTTVDSAVGEVELRRFCSKGRVAGGFSKLLKAFTRSHVGEFCRVVSYSDRRWSLGEVYSKNGFRLAENSDPNYEYVKGIARFNRRQFQKANLHNVLEKVDLSKTEWENCGNNGYRRIWNCGVSKWVLDL